MSDIDRCKSSRDVQLFCREWGVAVQHETAWENAVQQFRDLHPEFKGGQLGQDMKAFLIEHGLETSPSLENLEAAYRYSK